MSDLDEKLAEFFRDYGLGVGISEDDFVRQIKQAFIDAGWIKVPNVSMTKEGWIEVSTDKGVRHNGTPLMTGQEWLSKALHVFYDHQNDRDYFRNDEQFKASTVTMAEIESLLKRAAGIE